MGPNAESLALADAILAEHPSIKVNRIELAYTIMWNMNPEPKETTP